MISSSRWVCFVMSVVLMSLMSCHSSKSTTGSSGENFDKFYDKFHKDMTFQKSRLKFPLQGHNELGQAWTSANWQLMKGKIYAVDKSQYKVDIKRTSNSFFQKVWIDGASLN